MGIDKDRILTAAATELRRRAEERLQAKTLEPQPPRTVEETKRLVHELEVHQIELEMQNEELRRARDEAETTLDKYTDLYDFAPVGYLTLDRSGVISAVNLRGASLLGIERSQLVNRRFHYFVADNDISSFNTFLDSIFANQDKETCEVSILKERRLPIFVRMEAIADELGDECRMAFIDISERKRLQEELASKIVQLETAFVKVKQLEGIIPICSYCKNIRDDKESWQKLETYITEHSEALFSHGICPKCLEKELSALEKSNK